MLGAASTAHGRGDPHHLQPSSMVDVEAKEPFANHSYLWTYTTWS